MRWRRKAPRLGRLIDLGEWTGDAKVVGFSLGPSGEAIVLAAAEEDAAIAFAAREVGPGFASFPESRAARPYEASLLTVAGGDVDVRRLRGLTATYPFAQPLPDGEVLVVGARAQRRDDDHDLNAAVYGPEGSLASEFLLGDGIEDVQTTLDGTIWVSYFDEGVYGNFGWGDGDGPPPLGSSGLARFDRSGSLLWEFEPPVGGERIDDCYALNVGNDAAWAYYYASFPLVRITCETVESWEAQGSGAHAVAIEGDRVLFVGDYGKDWTRCLECRLGDRRLVEERRFSLATVDGKLSQGARIVARGPCVVALDGTTLYQLSVGDE